MTSSSRLLRHLVLLPCKLLTLLSDAARFLWLYLRQSAALAAENLSLRKQLAPDCMARENPSWGEERLANELLLKLGLRVRDSIFSSQLDQSIRHLGSRVL
jgi:hypothetical protein